MTLLLPEHAHSLVIERLREQATTPPASPVQAWLLRARIMVESQHLYGNFHMRQMVMRQAVGEVVREKSKKPGRLESQALANRCKGVQPYQYTSKDW